MTANKEKIIEVRGLKKTYGGEKKRGYKGLTPTLDVLKGIDIDIYRGDVVCLIGASGSVVPPAKRRAVEASTATWSSYQGRTRSSHQASMRAWACSTVIGVPAHAR